MAPALPVPALECPRRSLGDVSADVHAPAWNGIIPVHFRENVHGGTPLQGTEVRCAWNDAEFRVLFTCADEHVWAIQTKRDGPLWEEEVVEIFIDPVGDAKCYFEFEVNPLNTALDLVLRKNQSGWRKDFSWDCDGFRSAVQRVETGWNAEIAIPFGSIAAGPPMVGAEWRANFCRIDRPMDVPRELTAWSPTLLPTFHETRRFGRVRFVA
jgi:Carbohydrate family 9 binding domain-like